MLSAVSDLFASLSVADGSAQSWLRLPLTIHEIIHLTVLPHNPRFRDQWQFLRSNAKHFNFLSAVTSSPFSTLSAISNGLHQQISYLLQQVSPKSTGRSGAHAPSPQNSSAKCFTPLFLSWERCCFILTFPDSPNSIFLLLCWRSMFHCYCTFESSFKTAGVATSIYTLHSWSSSSLKNG